MKWKDLSLKERKQIYDSVRANNPDATYFDIKEQFDSIPEYEDGKAGYTPEERAWVARRTDVGSFIEDPSITNAVQVGLSKVGSKDLTTTSNKIVNTISSGFDFDDLTKVPAYQDGKGKTINKADLPPE